MPLSVLSNLLTSSGTSGLIFPFLLTTLLDHFSFRTTLRIWSGILLVLGAPLIYFVKPRLPPSSTPSPQQKFSYRFLTRRAFLSLQASNILESLGFFIPAIYIPSYAHSLGLSLVSSTVILALLNSFSVLGAISLGHLCDRLNVTTVIGISTLGSTLAILLLWGLATNFAVLIVFAATYGVFAGGFSAIWTGMFKEVQKGSPEVGMGVLMGLFSAGRGIGAVLSGPVSEVLLRYGGFVGARAGYATSYGALIAFTGVSAFCGLICFGARQRI